MLGGTVVRRKKQGGNSILLYSSYDFNFEGKVEKLFDMTRDPLEDRDLKVVLGERVEGARQIESTGNSGGRWSELDKAALRKHLQVRLLCAIWRYMAILFSTLELFPPTDVALK